MDPIYENSLDLNEGDIMQISLSVKKEKKPDIDLDISLVNHPDEATKQEELRLFSTLGDELKPAEVPVVPSPIEFEVVNTEDVSDMVVQSTPISEVVVSQVTEVVVVHKEEVVVAQSSSTENDLSPSRSASASTSTPTSTPSKTADSAAATTTTASTPSQTKWREIESVFSPPIDIIELKDSYHIYAELPGISVQDISIDLSDNKFTLTGDKRDHPRLNTPVKAKDSVVKQEITKGRFKRVLELPENVDTNDVNVDYEGGMLQFKIRKIAYDDEDDEGEGEGEGEEEGSIKESGEYDENENGDEVGAAAAATATTTASDVVETDVVITTVDDNEKSEENNNNNNDNNNNNNNNNNSNNNNTSNDNINNSGENVDDKMDTDDDNISPTKSKTHKKNLKGQKRKSCVVQ